MLSKDRKDFSWVTMKTKRVKQHLLGAESGEGWGRENLQTRTLYQGTIFQK